MKKLLLILLCLPFIGFGQGWEQTFGGAGADVGYSVQLTSDGGYIIAGNTESFGDTLSDIYLIKTDGNGVEQWSQTYGGTSYDAGFSVEQTTDGGFIITGNTSLLWAAESLDIGLIKTDANGVEQWNQTFGGGNNDYGFSVEQTTDGGYIIAGGAGSNISSNGGTDVYLIKTDINGNSLWTRTLGGASSDVGYSVQQTTDGGYIVCGETNSFMNGVNVYLIKTDTNGIEQWNQTFGGASSVGNSIEQTTDGGYIIVGKTTSFGNGSYDVYLIKTDGNGIEQWYKTYGGTSSEEGNSVKQTSDGGYIITGYTESFVNGGTDVYLIKTDANGVEQWSQTFGGTNNDYGSSVEQTADGGYIIAGSTLSFGNGGMDVYLIKTDGNGNQTSTFNIPVNPNRKLQKTVDMLGKQTKPKTNIPFIEIYDDGTVEKRIVIE
jgi:hypothetical protein